MGLNKAALVYITRLHFETLSLRILSNSEEKYVIYSDKWAVSTELILSMSVYLYTRSVVFKIWALVEKCSDKYLSKSSFERK